MKIALGLAALAILTAMHPVFGSGQSAAMVPHGDRQSARFVRCLSPVRVNCVVDGDTFWYRGAKIRIADINAPELSAPHCPAEAALAARATRRLTALLNAGRFTLDPADRATDSYGRHLFVVRRAGASLGAMLTAEGLAERWRGYRRNWC